MKSLNDGLQKSKKSGLISRLFSGDVSLPVAYWVFGVLVSIGIFLVSLAILALFNFYDIGDIWVFNIILFWLAYGVLIYIAIWRSAGKYQGLSVWKYLARLTVALSILRLIIAVLAR